MQRVQRAAITKGFELRLHLKTARPKLNGADPKDNIAQVDRPIELIARGQLTKEPRMTTRTLTASRLALAAAASVVCLFANDNLSSTRQSSLITQADAEVGRPLAPGSVAGVARRADRRAVRRDVAVGGRLLAIAYYGAGGYGRRYGAPGGASRGPP
jgi:hypothetical protein